MPKDGEPTVEVSEEAEHARMLICPRLELAQVQFMLTCPAATEEDKATAKDTLMAAVKESNMAPFYKYLCEQHGWMEDEALTAAMKKTNAAELVKFEATIKDAEEELGETEIREAHLAKSEYLCIIGDKDAAVAAFRVTTEKTVSLGHRLDIVFNLIRFGMFYGDNDLTVRNLEKAQVLMDEGGDWDRRNRLKVYKGAHCASIREFAQGTERFLATVSTFTSTEIMDYKLFVETTVLMAMITLPRVELNKKVVVGPEIQEVLHQSPMVKSFLESLYNCNYSEFFLQLAEVDKYMMKSRIFAPHRRFYVREMRIQAYAQLLESYRSVTLDSMAKSFGVTTDFIDRELSQFIATKRLNCKIDKVAGIVMTTRVDKKNSQYQATIKQGDALLNQIQKLSQVVNI